jgi:hypothetical protein
MHWIPLLGKRAERLHDADSARDAEMRSERFERPMSQTCAIQQDGRLFRCKSLVTWAISKDLCRCNTRTLNFVLCVDTV